jgi:hypothetical protein
MIRSKFVHSASSTRTLINQNSATCRRRSARRQGAAPLVEASHRALLTWVGQGENTMHAACWSRVVCSPGGHGVHKCVRRASREAAHASRPANHGCRSRAIWSSPPARISLADPTWDPLKMQWPPLPDDRAESEIAITLRLANMINAFRCIPPRFSAPMSRSFCWLSLSVPGPRTDATSCLLRADTVDTSPRI